MVQSPATLLEREREFAELGDAIRDVQHHRGRFVLLEAPAGMGKTSLLRVAASMTADAGLACLKARASELERDFAYGCVRQLLEGEVAARSAAQRSQLFAGAAALARPLFDPSGGQAAPSESAFLIRHGLYWLLNNRSAEEPVALLVDDLHWSDRESLRFLAYLAPRLDGLPVLVVGTQRPGEGEEQELARLAVAPETTVLRPGGLSPRATLSLCAGRLGGEVDAAFANACHDATGGNPFFLDALLRELEEQPVRSEQRSVAAVHSVGPREVARAVRLRLASRSTAALALVRAVAVLGARAGVDEASRLAGVTESEAAATADDLVALSILEPGGSLEFAHPIVREAVYNDIGPLERATMHARAAEVLVETGAPEERVAAQVVAAIPTGDVRRVELLRRVASDALARGAPAAAVAWLERALAEPPETEATGQVLLELSVAKLRLGTPEAAVDQLTQAAALVRDPRLVGRSVRMLAEALTWVGRAERAVEVVDRTLEGIEDREQRLLLEAERAACGQLARPETRARVTADLDRFAMLCGVTPGERLALASLAFAQARASETAADAAGYAERVLADPRLIDEQDLDVAGTLYLVLIGLLATDRLDTLEACLARLLEQAETRQSIPAQAFVIVHRGWSALRRGAVARAEADARTALELLTTYDIPLGRRYARALLVEALIEAGDVDAAECALAVGEGEDIPPDFTSNSLLEARALLALAQGRWDDAVPALIAFGRHDECYGSANPLASRWRAHAAIAMAAGGDPAGARELAAEDLERARRWGSASAVGIALRATALVRPSSRAIETLREAVHVLESSPARLEWAHAATDLGGALRRSNRRAEAREILEPALRVAEQLTAKAVAARARAELGAAGGRSGDPYGAGVEQLTASERRVAELAAQGKSNPEIAQTLFVTRKTVETHLGRVYRKLDISGRGELRAKIGEERQGGP